jgi:hypothetical protein
LSAMAGPLGGDTHVGLHRRKSFIKAQHSSSILRKFFIFVAVIAISWLASPLVSEFSIAGFEGDEDSPSCASPEFLLKASKNRIVQRRQAPATPSNVEPVPAFSFWSNRAWCPGTKNSCQTVNSPTEGGVVFVDAFDATATQIAVCLQNASIMSASITPCLASLFGNRSTNYPEMASRFKGYYLVLSA